ncbi:MAG: BatA domain-containing protein, partial [Kiritimatiellae bacterium]|nr:BatA domain-containing protein [Kiritimatiellia bacterium]
MLPLASLPVLFHLFYRMRRKQRLFSSLMFFLQADPRLRSRRRIREWLTLFLRVLAIIFLLLALARPVWVGVRGHGAASVVLVVDNSGSMTGPASDGRSKLSIAIEAARALVETLAEDDRVAVLLLVEDPAVPLPLGLTSDRESTLAALAGIRPTEASGMPIRVLGEALTLLRTASTQRREIHVFTDLQKTEWGKEGAVTVPIPVDTELIVHRIAGKSSGGKNLAIGSVIFGKKRIIVGRACSSLVEVMNQGDVDIRTRLCMVDHKGTSLTKEISVPHAQTISVPVVLRPSQPQLEWIHVWIEDDGFENDNHTYVAFTPLARQTVLFVGRPEAFEVLPLALAPESDGSLSGCLPVFCSSDRTPDLLRQKDVPAALVTTWEEMPGWPSSDPDWNTLRDFVSRGGVLLIVPPVPVATGSTRLPAWLGSEPQAARVAAEGLALVILDPANPLWDDIRAVSYTHL